MLNEQMHQLKCCANLLNSWTECFPDKFTRMQVIRKFFSVRFSKFSNPSNSKIQAVFISYSSNKLSLNLNKTSFQDPSLTSKRNTLKSLFSDLSTSLLL